MSREAVGSESVSRDLRLADSAGLRLRQELSKRSSVIRQGDSSADLVVLPPVVLSRQFIGLGERFLNTNQKLTAAILAALGAHTGGAYAASDTGTEAATSTSLEEVIVTAQRRNESSRTCRSRSRRSRGEQLKQLNVTTFNDLLKYTPNVTFSGNGPGTGNIFMRGLSSGGSGNQSQSTTAPFPNVALYLDDQSMQFPARNNDVYLVDMERVEVLEGPQGTLFGGGAQAGAIRYITNKPKLDVTEGNANAGYGITAGGDPNSNINATLNLPLIADKLARARAWSSTTAAAATSTTSPGTIPGAQHGHHAECRVRPVRWPTTPASPGNEPQHGDLHRLAALGAAARSTTTGMCCCSRTTRTWRPTAISTTSRSARTARTAAVPDQRVRAALQQGQATRARPGRSTASFGDLAGCELKAVYTGSYMIRHIDAAAGLFELPAQRARLVLRLHRARAPAMRTSGPAKPTTLLLAGRLLARHGAQHAPEPRAAHQHLGGLAHARRWSARSGRSSSSTTT